MIYSVQYDYVWKQFGDAWSLLQWEPGRDLHVQKVHFERGVKSVAVMDTEM